MEGWALKGSSVCTQSWTVSRPSLCSYKWCWGRKIPVLTCAHPSNNPKFWQNVSKIGERTGNAWYLHTLIWFWKADLLVGQTVTAIFMSVAIIIAAKNAKTKRGPKNMIAAFFIDFFGSSVAEVSERERVCVCVLIRTAKVWHELLFRSRWWFFFLVMNNFGGKFGAIFVGVFVIWCCWLRSPFLVSFFLFC